MVKCSECGVVWECGVTFFIYLIVIIDEIFGVVALGGGVSECTKSGVVCISVIVFAAAYRRTTNAFASDFRTCSDILFAIAGCLDK